MVKQLVAGGAGGRQQNGQQRVDHPSQTDADV
jgi:hypothetical protein